MASNRLMAWATVLKDAKIVFQDGENLHKDPQGDPSIYVEKLSVGQYRVTIYIRAEITKTPSVQITPYCEDGNYDGGASTDNIFSVGSIDPNYQRKNIIRFIVISKDVAGQKDWKYQDAAFSFLVIGHFY